MIECLNIFTLGVISYGMIYHLFLFFGRKEINNLYFAVFSLSIIAFIITRRNFLEKNILHDNLTVTYLIERTTAWLSLAVIGLSGSGFIKKIIKYDNYKTKRNDVVIRTTQVIATTFFILAALSVNFVERSIYLNYLEPLYNTIPVFSLFFIFIYLIYIGAKNKVNDIYMSLLSFAIIIFSIYFTSHIPPHLFNGLLTNNFTPVGIGMILFSYLLCKVFSDEFFQLQKVKKELQDYTDDLEIKVEHRTKLLKEADDRKTDFLVNLSHETKTPLTLIQSYLDKYLKNNKLTEDLKVIKVSLDKLTRDMVNIFEMESITHGKTIYNHNNIINLNDVVTQNVNMFNIIAKSKNIEIKSDLKKESYIYSDPGAIERIINNLLDNAIKYSQNNTQVVINSTIEQNFVTLSISNTGEGISEDDLQNIFTPYYQINREKRNYQGIGMGLNIVKKAVDSLDGSINVESVPGDKTTFTVTFNKAEYIKEDMLQNITPLDEKYFYTDVLEVIEKNDLNKKYNILVVEDNKEMLHLLNRELSECFNVITASNGKDALVKIESINNTDLIISDIMMDEMDGYEFLENINTNDDYKDIPFLFITAKSSNHDVISGLSNGAIDYITKPFNMDALILKIKNLLQKRDFITDKVESNTISCIESFLQNKKYNDTHNTTKDDFLKKCLDFDMTSREREVAELLITGISYTDISDKLFISKNTTESHIKKIYKKAGVNSKMELKKVFE